ncbi:Glycoside hydrolase, family 28 [Dillenia turbinata]|uniref:Glycoside hydrolase, family 28 n=1 Tax=Dillenia turbinata TaxID=194707 RepID=A0AAN8YXG2_9MAGN
MGTLKSFSHRKTENYKMGFKLNITLLFVLLLWASDAEAQAAVFDVTKYGARPDGMTDISQALLTAWKAACNSTTASTILIPTGTYMLGPVKLEGLCKAPLKLQVQGTVKAPADPAKFKGFDGWLTINRLNQFTMSGGGIFDAQGEVAWKQNDCAKTGKCNSLPTSFRFNFISNSIITDITSLDSKLFHVNVIGCNNLTFQHVNVTAPDESLNTDGIHIGRSNGVYIIDSLIGTGDDCVSLGDGSKQVKVSNVTCGPGHGMSVGSLGRYPKEDDVVGFSVINCTFTNTDNGVRIKTWPASYAGVASDLHFENLIMNNVGNPILIDQEYCPYNQCTKSKPSQVKLSKVSFKNIRGTCKTPLAVKLACSSGFPCQGVEIGDINLTYNGKGTVKAEVSNVKPKVTGKMIPALP